MDQGENQTNGALRRENSQTPSADVLDDLLGPLAIEDRPGALPGVEGVPTAADAAALVPVGEQINSVQVSIKKNTICGLQKKKIKKIIACIMFSQPIGNIAERFQALYLKDSGVLYEDPNIQVCFSPSGLRLQYPTQYQVLTVLHNLLTRLA